MNTQNLTSLEPVGAQNTGGSMNPSSRSKIYGAPLLCARMGVGRTERRQRQCLPSKTLKSKENWLMCEHEPTTRKKERMSLKPQAQLCCRAKPGSEIACALALTHRKGNEDSSTDIGRKVETRAKQSWREGHEQRSAGWAWRENDFIPTQGRLRIAFYWIKLDPPSRLWEEGDMTRTGLQKGSKVRELSSG